MIKMKKEQPPTKWLTCNEVENSPVIPVKVSGGFSMLKTLFDKRKNECQQC